MFSSEMRVIQDPEAFRKNTLKAHFEGLEDVFTRMIPIVSMSSGNDKDRSKCSDLKSALESLKQETSDAMLLQFNAEQEDLVISLETRVKIEEELEDIGNLIESETSQFKEELFKEIFSIIPVERLEEDPTIQQALQDFKDASNGAVVWLNDLLNQINNAFYNTLDDDSKEAEDKSVESLEEGPGQIKEWLQYFKEHPVDMIRLFIEVKGDAVDRTYCTRLRQTLNDLQELIRPIQSAQDESKDSEQSNGRDELLSFVDQALGHLNSIEPLVRTKSERVKDALQNLRLKAPLIKHQFTQAVQKSGVYPRMVPKVHTPALLSEHNLWTRYIEETKQYKQSTALVVYQKR